MPNDETPEDTWNSEGASIPVPTFSFQIERNTKGFNFAVSISNCHSEEEATRLRTVALDQAFAAIREATQRLQPGIG